ncbi:protein SSUH2 homolog [Electrophorus electricus]|uniref:Protein SSUH2 homolog n=1 Tax=Electrophorus electricus TaxID=8005 RepID=A0A4W4HM74_ELEEL|nr:protein SSUH2 homolog [Electrophorus electricus]
MAYPVNQAMYPPAFGMQAPPTSFPGYEGLVPGVSGGFLPPPPPQVLPTPVHTTQQDWSIPRLSEEAAREAFTSFVDSHCCYSSEPVKDGVITSMEQFNTFRYRLETFTESRKTEWATKPYEGETMNPFTQPPPGPWEMPVKAPVMFKDHVQELEIPNSQSIKPCDTCSASGRVKCNKCSGTGSITCSTCRGAGKDSAEDRCNSCNGTGKQKCSDCSGQGTEECGTCKGKRQLLSYIKLMVQWKNNVEDFIVEQSSGLDVANLGEVSGKPLFKDALQMVYPMTGFPHPGVAEASEKMVMEHRSKYSQSGRIMQQQQSIELIPISKVNYQWKGKQYFYFVYGTESKVKADDYPATCCCIIL